MFFGSIALMLWYSPPLTAISVGVTLLPLVISVFTGNRLAAAEKRVSDRNQDFTAALTDCLSGFSVIKNFRAQKEILHEISAEFEAGKAYAVVGASGSGKSTLLNLLMASSADDSGMISVIQQNVFVFNTSIRDNVTMFRDFPREEMDCAIRCAHLDGLLSDRGKSYLGGEMGNGLSGGEKQRVSIARSLLKKSTVLLADEVTAALDAETAWQVSNDILDLTGITRVVVTHFMEESLLRRYDSILVLKDGQAVESGTFDELMMKGGYFYALYNVAQ